MGELKAAENSGIQDGNLSAEDIQSITENFASEIVRRGLTVPAILFLEMHKPLSYIASQGAVVLSPFFIPFIGYDNLRILSRYIEKRENVERLICRIEELQTLADNRTSKST
jgi:hypothetical protein